MTGALSLTSVQTEIGARRPIETGIYRTAGGGQASAASSPADDVVAAVRAAQPQLSAFYGQLDRRAGVARAGTPGTAPATFAYYAVRTAASTGRQATVWVERAADGWTATNFTTGTEELTYPAQAGGDLVFTEPQVNAWYRVRDGRVPALNDPGRRGRAGGGVPAAGARAVRRQAARLGLPGAGQARWLRLGRGAGFGAG